MKKRYPKRQTVPLQSANTSKAGDFHLFVGLIQTIVSLVAKVAPFTWLSSRLDLFAAIF